MAMISAVGLTVLLPVYALPCCKPCVSLKSCTVTNCKLMVLPLQKSSIHEYSSRENWMTNPVAYEMNNFIFQVNFVEEKRPNFKMSYLSFYCEFQATLNTRLKSRICSDGLQNFTFVQWKLAPDNTVKWSDPFHDSKKKNGAAECVPVCEYKSSIKFGLLPRKGKKSKWHSTQIFFTS